MRVTVSTEYTATCCSRQWILFCKENCVKTCPFYECFGCTSTYFASFVRIYTLFPFAERLAVGVESPYIATELKNGLISILLRITIMIQSVRIRMEINVHCLCGLNAYMVFTPLETYVFLAPLMRRQENFVPNGITTIYSLTRIVWNSGDLTYYFILCGFHTIWVQL